MTGDQRRHGDTDAAKSKAPRTILADVLAAWSRLDESSQVKFFAALLRAAMAKPVRRSELDLWFAVMDDWERDMTAAVIADLACQRPDD
jgi:hypothetical protein